MKFSLNLSGLVGGLIMLVGATAFCANYDSTKLDNAYPTASTVDKYLNNYIAGFSDSGIYPAKVSTWKVVKYDAFGARIWGYSRRFSVMGYPGSLNLDAQGNLYVTGSLWKKTLWDAAAHDSVSPGYTMVLQKFNSSGSLLWERYWHRNDSTSDTLVRLSFDASNNAVLAFNSWGSVSAPGVLKYSPDGTLLWSCAFDVHPGINPNAWTMRIKNNSIYLGGMAWTNVSQFPWFAKITLDKGNKLWQKISDSSGSFADIMVDPADNFYCISNKDGRGRVEKYDGQGALVWRKGNDSLKYSSGCTNLSGSQLWVKGTKFDGYVAAEERISKFGADGAIQAVVREPSLMNVWYSIVKVDEAGNCITFSQNRDSLLVYVYDQSANRIATFGRPANGEKSIQLLIKTMDLLFKTNKKNASIEIGLVLLTWKENFMTVEPITLSVASTSLKSDPDLTNGISLGCEPNPFNPSATVTFNLPRTSNVTISLHGVDGRVVRTMTQDRFASGSHTVKLDGSFLASGAYFCRMQAENKILVLPVMLKK